MRTAQLQGRKHSAGKKPSRSAGQQTTKSPEELTAELETRGFQILEPPSTDCALVSGETTTSSWAGRPLPKDA